MADKFYNGLRIVELLNDPITPPSGEEIIYAKTDGKVYCKNSSGTVTEITSGGGGSRSTSPSGTNQQIQFNDNGSFGGIANFLYDKINNILSLVGINPTLQIKGIVDEPPIPPADNLILYSKKIAGKMVWKTKSPSGLDYPLQAAFWQNNIIMWYPTNATGGFWLGTVGATAGTYSNFTRNTSNTLYQSIKKSIYSNVVTTTNQILGVRNTESIFYRSSITGAGGFFFYTRFGFDVWTNGGRLFSGFHETTQVVSANVSSRFNYLGFCIEDTDNGLISVMSKGVSTGNKVSTGISALTGKGLDAYIFCPPNGNEVFFRIVDFTNNVEFSTSMTTNLPTVLLTTGVLASNGALTPVNSVRLGINRIYVETDY